MDDTNDTPRGRTSPPEQREERSDRSSARRFGYEMAFDARFEGRRWRDVEPELRLLYPDWLREHGHPVVGDQAWDGVKGMVREAWESALDVERMQVDPRTGRWEDLAPEYRRLWEERKPPTGATWADVEPGYRYAVEMGADPRFQGRQWGDVAPYLEAGLPGWAASHGYQLREGESLWERLRDNIHHVWERVHARRDRNASSR